MVQNNKRLFPNPAVGYASDLLVALGGKVLLAEFPELCGAEQETYNQKLQGKRKFNLIAITFFLCINFTGCGIFLQFLNKKIQTNAKIFFNSTDCHKNLFDYCKCTEI
jgi:hypothetical protein